MSFHLKRRLRLVLFLAAVLSFMVSGTAAPAFAAEPSPGDPTITINVNDSTAGGDIELTFEKVYSGTTPEGTSVYIYVPQGALQNPAVPGNNPQYDPNPNDAFVPCADRAVADYTVTQTQINALGDALANRIVAVDETHYGETGLADPSDPDSDAIVVLAYNALDDFYYDCAEETYTAGYFAPDFISTYGMNVIVVDTYQWASRVGDANGNLYEGVIAHELEHLLMNYSDPGELSWVDEGLADFAIFLNGYTVGGSHLVYHQVFHRETSLTRWGGGLENYGASYTFFQYLWEQAGGNGDGTFTPDRQYDNAGGDLLIKLIFENQADGMEGVQAAINQFNAAGHPGLAQPLRSADALFKDWVVAIYLDDENSQLYNIKAVNFGSTDSRGWTIDIANQVFFSNRGIYKGAMPDAKWRNFKRVPSQTALPFGTSYEVFRNPGPTFSLLFDGDDQTVIAPHSGSTHWYAGYQSQSDHVLDVDAGSSLGGQTIDFWTWYFIEEGWDYGFVEALVNGDWVTVPLTNDAGQVVTTSGNPHGNNTEGNGLTGTSGGAYFVDAPQYIHLSGVLPAGATDVRFRYSTDAAYLDTGWFVDDVRVNGSSAALSSAPGDWFETNGEQNNNWLVQVIATCDLTPGVTSAGELVDGSHYIYRFEGDYINQAGFSTRCMNSTKDTFTVAISNMPTGDLTVLDAPYTFRITNTSNSGK